MQILVAGIDGKWCWKSLSRSMSSPERMFCMCKAVEMLCKNKLCTGFSHLNPGRHWPFKLKLLQGKGVGVYYLHWQSFIVFAFYYFLKDICTSGSNMCTWQFSCNAYQMLCSKSYANLVLFEWRRTSDILFKLLENSCCCIRSIKCSLHNCMNNDLFHLNLFFKVLK